MIKKLKNFICRKIGYKSVVDTQINIYNKLKKKYPNLSEQEVLNKLIKSRISSALTRKGKEKECLYYNNLENLFNKEKDLEEVILKIVRYEYILSRKTIKLTPKEVEIASNSNWKYLELKYEK